MTISAAAIVKAASARDLLLYNRRRVAEKEVQEQGQQAMVLGKRRRQRSCFPRQFFLVAF